MKNKLSTVHYELQFMNEFMLNPIWDFFFGMLDKSQCGIVIKSGRL